MIVIVWRIAVWPLANTSTTPHPKSRKAPHWFIRWALPAWPPAIHHRPHQIKTPTMPKKREKPLHFTGMSPCEGGMSTKAWAFLHVTCRSSISNENHRVKGKPPPSVIDLSLNWANKDGVWISPTCSKESMAKNYILRGQNWGDKINLNTKNEFSLLTTGTLASCGRTAALAGGGWARLAHHC